MELTDLLLVIILQTILLIVLVWFIRTASAKLVRRFDKLEKFVLDLSETTEKLRRKHEQKEESKEETQSMKYVAQIQPEKPASSEISFEEAVAKIRAIAKNKSSK